MTLENYILRFINIILKHKHILVILLHKIKDFFIGILIGAGAILPGVSSGVICVITGIYDKLIASIFNLFKDFKKNFTFLLPLAVGGFVGVFLFGNILKTLFNMLPVQTSFCFIGLILGSIPLLVKKINHEHTFKLHYLLFTIASFALGYFLVILENNFSFNLVSDYSFGFLVLSGFLMSIGVIVPGVSNTVILMCLGVYSVYINAIATLNLSILIPIGIGLILGCIIFLVIIKYLLKHFYMQTYYSIIGFTLGSVLVLYSPISFDFVGFISVILLVLGFWIAGKLERI